MTRGAYHASWQRCRPQVERSVREQMSSVRPSHGFDHVQRVLVLASRIAAEEGADEDVVEAAALLHDIGRQREDDAAGAVCHATEGARRTRRLLVGLGLAEPFVAAVTHCVKAHRFRGEEAPRTLEAQVLFDADKLDSIGAVGLGRAFLFAGEVGARLHNPGVDPRIHPDRGPEDTALREFTVKLVHVKDRLHTAAARALAQERHDFMVRFFTRLDDEVLGLR